MTEFKDHFSSVAQNYSLYRPNYPDELFEFLVSVCKSHNHAWDAATGNGQTAIALAKYFAHIDATDASTEQLEHAIQHPKIAYSRSMSEQTNFADHHFDLVTVSAALHWFDFENFYKELKRVLKPNGIFAAWTYRRPDVSDKVDAIVRELYQILEPHWPPERKYVDANYSTIPFPLTRIAAPSFSLETDWSSEQLINYIRTWSGTQKYFLKFGSHSLDAYWQQIRDCWPSRNQSMNLKWPLYVLIGHF